MYGFTAALHSSQALSLQTSVAFPTEQRTRQKIRKQAGQVAKKRPQIVEDHHDDCGEDFGPLGDDFLVTAYFEELQLDYSGGIYNGGIYLQLDGRTDPKDQLRLALMRSRGAYARSTSR